MSFADKEFVCFYSRSDEEPFDKIYYPTSIEDISHVYWDDNGLCVSVARRSAPEDYWLDDASRSETSFEDLRSRHGLVQLGPRMWVPVRNIGAVGIAEERTCVDIGDLYEEISARSVGEIVQDCRWELQRVYLQPAPASECGLQDGIMFMAPEDVRAAIARFDRMGADHGATPFLPGL